MNSFTHVPPGFRFHPTDEELVDYYLRKKIASKRIDLDVIKEIDLYRIEPWDLQELCRIGSQEQNEWYFFSHKDKKYPTGTRTNRATKAGFWKATGRDKAIYCTHNLIGMRKTLQEEGWVVCRAFKKRIATTRKEESVYWYEDQVSFMPDFDPPTCISQSQPLITSSYHHHPHSAYTTCKQELELQYNNIPHHHDHPLFLQLPNLESPKLPNYGLQEQQMQQLSNQLHMNKHEQALVDDQVADWRVLDKFVASQLSHEDVHNNSNEANSAHLCEQDMAVEFASISTSSSQVNLWK
ncbi:hypothetical protein BUALT_Bualt05G0073200 [Buddleja alternifolia]|uniref:NAC domain-containing protein n=1 Tax=Buddleja alternifolia TaxID=168488 RepID=A0AAV6XIV1_9LAMI|nr:hypothetical protein BUALT_Bualt05G0073200 [Buddleja alternifolia]